MYDPKYVVIESEGIKRECPLPASIYVPSRDIAHRIRDAMNALLGDEGVAGGWTTIHADDAKSAGPNTKPRPWKD